MMCLQGLFQKLYEFGINVRVSGAITSLYDNVKCYVRINGLKTDHTRHENTPK